MKRGVIMYITGNTPEGWDEGFVEEINNLDFHADMVEVVLSEFDSYDIHYAWWKLITKGIQSINCKLAIFNSSKELIVTEKELRLCG